MPPSQPLPHSMVAWQHWPSLFSAGPLPKTLKLSQIAAVPPLKAKQTLVKVLTAGLNPVDYKLGELPVVTRLALGSPSTPGIEFVGRVWATNLPDSDGIKAGDLVYGVTGGSGPYGSLAGFTVATGSEAVVKIPEGIEEIDWCAGIGVAGLTAYQSIVPELEKSGDGSAQGKSVFINGSSGGVGTYGVQIAKAIGCEHIVATCSAANADLVRSLGATEVIDYRSVNVADALTAWVKKNNGKKFDLFVDNAGADMGLYWHAHEYLAEGAKYMFVGAGISFKALSDVSKAMLWPKFAGGGRRQFAFLQLSPSKTASDRITRWMVEGKLKAVIDSTFTMDQAPQAYERLKTGRARGKIVVRVSEDGRGPGH